VAFEGREEVDASSDLPGGRTGCITSREQSVLKGS
jgi:hypothetical protein